MSAETIGMVSGLLVIISVIPYSIRTYQGKVHPNLTSFSLWTLIGLALLLTYKSSGAKASIWPAMFGVTNPLLVAVLTVRQRGGLTKLNPVEIACVVLGLASLGLWLGVRESRELSQFALYLAIVADACAAIPTVVFVWQHPDEDRPFAWCFFSIGYGLALFAIRERTISNYVLPIYMALGSMCISVPLILYRWRNRIPLREWV